MTQDTLKISQALSDPTRLAIYKYMSSRRLEVTVQEIANKFNIHPNVARLHLSKLVNVGMIDSETKKTGKGGRPSRIYNLSNEVVKIQFPFRDYERLAKMALEALVNFGVEGMQALQKIGYEYGRESAIAYTNHLQIDIQTLSRDEKVTIIEQIAVNQGLNPNITTVEKTGEVRLDIYNCTFNELLAEHSVSLCSMHHSMFSGIFSYFFGEHKLIRNTSDTDETTHVCSYSIV